MVDDEELLKKLVEMESKRPINHPMTFRETNIPIVSRISPKKY